MGAPKKAGKAAAGTGRRKRAAAPARYRGTTVVVTEEERSALVEDIAYFSADRYRCVKPGECREEDRRRAELEIDAIIKRCGKSG
jgi:hypothetical protein